MRANFYSKSLFSGIRSCRLLAGEPAVCAGVAFQLLAEVVPVDSKVHNAS